MLTARAIAAGVHAREASAVATVTAALDRAEQLGPERSGFTRLLRRRALARAEAVDRAVEAGHDCGPLAGVPFGVSAQFDVSGEITRVGSRTRDQAPFASRDARAIALLEAAGAVLIGTQAMDEYNYGFTCMAVRNPHDPERVAGGAAGGSAVAVATGTAAFALAIDTNGSVRVPAGLTGVIGLKPTYGDLPREGCHPFVDSLDVTGVLTRDIDDLALVRAILREGRPECADAPGGEIRFGRLMSWFDANMTPEMRGALNAFWSRLGRIAFELPHAEIARAAASVVIAAEGASVLRPALETRLADFEAPVRDRMLAGLLMTSDEYLTAQRFRNFIQAHVRRQFQLTDVLFTPAVAGFAPRVAEPTMTFDGHTIPARSHLGIYTQPISLVGLPALVLPLAGDHALPLGVQLIAGAGNEPLLLRAARQLVEQGLCKVPDLAF
jgi:AtzE family amidohydrolase